MEKDIKDIIPQMTLEEKASLCSGVSAWNTISMPNHGIQALMLTDGPHGLRKQTGTEDHMGLNESAPATCFPTAAGLASSWNKELVEKVGKALGEECQAEGVQILLGPGTNIKRSPLCGRNFEYFSEDPYLSSELTKKHINGVQSEGVGTSLKHFAANNQETQRFNIDVMIDERTLREIYLASFEGAIVDSQPWTVMSAYNKINGQYCSENHKLLTEILRDEWGFKGFVVSDWGAVSERDAALSAGMDLEMPTSNGIGTKKIIKSIEDGSLSVDTLDTVVERILRITFMALENKKENASYDKNAHHELAREVASESMVLLKNDNDVLPLKKKGKIAVIGDFVKNPRFQGAGSSRVNPTKLDIIYDEMAKTAQDADLLYAKGYSLNSDKTDNDMIKDAIKVASDSDVAILFVGLPEKYDAEGVDRKHLRLPGNQNALIEAIAEVQSNTVIVLLNGSAVEMPWVNQVKGILEAYLGGQAMGGAITDLLFGDRNPSGKLAETFPEKLSHSSSFINFPGERDKVEYREGLFVGYRYHDQVDITPLFPFGYGLSYTTFKYSDLHLDKKEMLDSDQVTVTVTVKNIGKQFGKEIVQLYVKDVESSVIRPIKELKGFEKVALNPGEEQLITFTLGKRAFAFYQVELKDWYVESGDFEILIGKSSQEIILSDTVQVKSTVSLKKKFTLDSTLGEIREEPSSAHLVSEIINGMGFGGSDSEAPFGMDMDSILHSLKLRILEAHGGFSKEKLEELLKAINKE